MKNRIPPDRKEQSKRVFRFGYVGVFMMALSSAFDFKNGLYVSATLAVSYALVLSLILACVYFMLINSAIAAIVVSINFFLILSTIAEGLKSGSYLFILTLLFAIPFLAGNYKRSIIETVAYLSITVSSFCICILFCNETSKWQQISPDVYGRIFTFNSICATIMCAVFAYMGIYFEMKFRADIIAAKNRAEKQEQQIKQQNAHLHDIAFMNSHIVRSPLANILALTELIDSTSQTEAEYEELMRMLKTSTQQLDANIREMVSKSISKTTEDN